MPGRRPQRWTRVIDDTEEMSEMYGPLTEEILLQEMRQRADAMRTARNEVRIDPGTLDREAPAGRRWWRRVVRRAR